MSAASPFALADPEWLAHRHVEDADAVRFLHVPRTDRSQVPFLTDANLGERVAAPDVPIASCLDAAERPRTLCWLFHSAFCGSTLLAHALDMGGAASSLSEPVLLNDMVGARRRGAPPAAVARLADVALRLLARPYPGERAVVVKPSNIVNPLAELLLALAPQAPAVFLFAPLETFVLSVARKGLPCRLWVRELLEGYLRDDFVALGLEPGEYFRLTDLQVAAVGWLAQHGHFQRLAAALPDGRLKLLDADRMMADPAGAVTAVAVHYRLGVESSELARVASGPAFARHSKSGGVYSAEARRADYAAASAAYGDEIGVVLDWAHRVAEGAGIALAPPPALLLAHAG